MYWSPKIPRPRTPKTGVVVVQKDYQNFTDKFKNKNFLWKLCMGEKKGVEYIIQHIISKKKI